MKIASFNVENLFSRVKVMNLEDASEGKPILFEYSNLSNLLLKATYTDSDKSDILESLKILDLLEDDDSKYVILRQNRGRLITRPQDGDPTIVANGRGDWIGWLELKTQAVNEIAMEMTARVIKDVNADILAVIEAENRISLTHFNNQILNKIDSSYDEIMLIDGNDERGIDVGILTKQGINIGSVVSHINDKIDGKPIFSRDCPEYTVWVDGLTSILILVNHFKSKGYGSSRDSDARRKAQAQRVREIYEQRKAEGVEHIAIVGDFNDTPDSEPLSPLLGDDSDLKDISEHPNFVSDGREGTYKNGTANQKIDYILLSSDLFNKVTGGGIFRKGVWGGVNGTLFPHYEEMKKSANAASDHAAIWAEIDL